MKTSLLPVLLLLAVNAYSQKVTVGDLIGFWQLTSPAEKNASYYLDFVHSSHYNMIDSVVFPNSPILISSYGTLYMNYQIDTSASYTIIETWAGTNPAQRLYHTDFYMLRIKGDLLLMKYMTNRNVKWEDCDTAYLKKYKRWYNN
jgi:hypothetical protein